MCNTVIISHAIDNDGRVGELVVRESLGEKTSSTSIFLDNARKIIKPVWELEGDEKPVPLDLDLNIFNSKHVVFVDMMLTIEQMDYISKIANSLKVFDHHGAALKYKGKRDYISNATNIKRCGALCAFKGLYGEDKKAPLLVQYVNDRDLFTKAYPNCDGVKLAIEESSDNELIKAFYSDEYFMSHIYKKGEKLYLGYMDGIREAVKKHVKLGVFDGHRVLFSELTDFKINLSDLGNTALRETKHKDIEFYINIAKSKDKVSYALRSLEGVFDCQAYCEARGGGGHYGASGYQV